MAFSGAFCAGLIEAADDQELHEDVPRFPALFAPASLKPSFFIFFSSMPVKVFRRFLRRPH